jgi:phage terminase large subunit-like protein
VLREWQKDLSRQIFSRESGLRHRINLVGMPRKNGKSAYGSTVALYSLLMGADGGEVYSVAATRDQARIVFNDAKRMLQNQPELMNMVKIYRDAVEVPLTGSIYRVLSAEHSSAEGLSPTMTVFDELHAMPSRDMFDVMSLAMGARGRLAMMVAITTAGVKVDNKGQDSIAYSLYNYGKKVARGEVDDDSFFMAWYEAAEEADHRDPETWKDANPGYGDLNSIEDFESAVRRTPEAEFRTKRCNQWVSSQQSWLPTGAWDKQGNEFKLDPDQEYVLGFDGSFSGDATVIVGCTVPKEKELPQIFMVKAWEKDENIHDNDWRVEIAEVEQTLIKFTQDNPLVREIACDPYRWQRSMEALADLGLPIVEWPSTSARRMVPACAKLYDAIVDGEMHHDTDPTLARHFDNAVVKTDNLGTRIVKDKRSSNRRIDAAVAAVLAFDRATARMEEVVLPQVFV